jgi:hypothetical protein
MNCAVVVFNSLVNAIGSNNNDLTYQFDWSGFEECEYEVSFSYHGLNNKNNGTKMPLVFIDLGVVPKVFQTSTSNYANQSLFLGTLLAGEKVSGDAPYIANYTENVPIIIGSRPRNQTPRIFIQNIDGTPFTDSDSVELADYVLALRFEKKREYD